MGKYVILSRLSARAFDDPGEFNNLAETVAARIKSDCPGVNWKHSYATMGRFDVVDVIEADDPIEVERAAMIIRAYGHAITETMPATEWHDFLKTL